MKIILKKEQSVLKEIEINPNDFDQIIFGTDNVKEICFVRDINNSDEQKLQRLFDSINEINYKEATSIIVFYDKEHYFSYNFSVKNVYYRVLSYMRNRQLVSQENLSIRLLEDNQPMVDFINNIAVCDQNNCIYFNSNYCNKYKTKLNKYQNSKEYTVCEYCYLETWNTSVIGRQFLNNMSQLYK